MSNIFHCLMSCLWNVSQAAWKAGYFPGVSTSAPAACLSSDGSGNRIEPLISAQLSMFVTTWGIWNDLRFNTNTIKCEAEIKGDLAGLRLHSHSKCWITRVQASVFDLFHPSRSLPHTLPFSSPFPSSLPSSVCGGRLLVAAGPEPGLGTGQEVRQLAQILKAGSE